MTDTMPSPPPSEVETAPGHSIPPAPTFREELTDILGNLLDDKLRPVIAIGEKVEHLETVLTQALMNFELATREFEHLRERTKNNTQDIVDLTRRMEALEGEVARLRSEIAKLQAA